MIETEKRPCTCDRFEIGKPYRKGQCRLCWLYHHDERYHRGWGGVGTNLVVTQTRALPAVRGPGTELKAILADMGITPDEKCGCNSRTSEMDKWGVAGCRENFDTIVGWLKQGYLTWGWKDKLSPQVQANMEIIDPFPELVREAIDRAEKKNPVIVNMGAGGIGDALLGLTILGDLQILKPGKNIVYKVGHKAMGFVNLFDGGYTFLAPHNHDTKALPPGDIQMNLRYREECRSHASMPRWERYARNIGVSPKPRIPPLRDRERLKALGTFASGCVMLFPECAWPNRTWRIESWITLERLLIEQGHDVRIAVPTYRTEFQSAQVAGVIPEILAGSILNASITVSSDSGMAHLAGLMGCKTIALCGATRGSQVYGCYPSVEVMQGKLYCDGCHWQHPYTDDRCEKTCASLQSILPSDVAEKIKVLCG